MTILPCDREAAAKAAKTTEWGERQFIIGKRDRTLLVESLAAHREAERDAIVAWLRDVGARADDGLWHCIMIDIANAIEANEHHAKGEG